MKNIEKLIQFWLVAILVAIIITVPAEAGNNEWTSNWINNDVRVDSIAFSPDYMTDQTIFASKGRYCDAYTSNSFISTDKGGSWLQTGPGGVLAISPNFKNDEIVFVGGNTYKIFKSSDGGINWVDLLISGSCLGDMAISPDYQSGLTLFATTISGVRKSDNGGTTWVTKNNGLTSPSNGLLAISPDFGNDNTLFFGSGIGVFKTVDGGENWINLNSGLPTQLGYTSPNIISIVISPNSDQILYVISDGGIFKSTDGANTWVQVGTQTYGTLAISPNYASDNTIFYGAGSNIYRSRDAGVSWELLSSSGFPSSSSVLTLEISPDYTNDKTIFAGTHKGVYEFTNIDNSAPTADAGTGQAVHVTDLVTLDGSGSTDPDGDLLTYSWAFTSEPTGSTATLTNPNSVNPSFTVDKAGDYILSLVVNDGTVNSVPDTVTVSTLNSAPIADPGTSQSVEVNHAVTLDGSNSWDPDENPLTYKWALSSIPQGSLSTINNPTAVTTTFVPDLPGTYVVQLIVNDGFIDSDPKSIQLLAVTSNTDVIESVQSLETNIATFESIMFKNANMQNTLLNKLNAVIANIESGNFAAAKGQLENDILGKTDGCANSGAPDKNDWVKDCATQGIIYGQILDIIAKIEALM